MYYTQPKVNNSEYQMHEGKERKEEAWKYGPEGKGVERRRVGRGGEGKGMGRDGSWGGMGRDGSWGGMGSISHYIPIAT